MGFFPYSLLVKIGHMNKGKWLVKIFPFHGGHLGIKIWIAKPWLQYSKENSNKPLEHPPDPQLPVYEGNLFVLVFWGAWGLFQGFPGIVAGVCWNFILNIGVANMLGIILVWKDFLFQLLGESPSVMMTACGTLWNNFQTELANL